MLSLHSSSTGNGLISLEEWQDPEARDWLQNCQGMAALFHTYDTDGNGQLDHEACSLRGGDGPMCLRAHMSA